MTDARTKQTQPTDSELLQETLEELNLRDQSREDVREAIEACEEFLQTVKERPLNSAERSSLRKHILDLRLLRLTNQ